MKNKLLKITVLGTACALGFGLLTNINKASAPVSAAQHVDNFDPYTYNGDYYDDLDTSGTDGITGTFYSALGKYVFPKGWYTYGGGGSDHLSTILQYADEDPTNSSNMIYLYTRNSVTKVNAGSGTWNREHVWPQSNSRGNSGQHWGTSEAGTDILHIRPTYEKTNSTRGNDIYGDTGKTGQLTYNGMPYGYSSGGVFEPLDSVKGDVARIVMYVWTTYYDYYKDTALKITKTFKNYDTLLKWHIMDRPDVSEGHRNDFSETSRQKNRNPFVDHPEYAWRVFGSSASATVLEECKNAYPGDGKSVTGIALSGEPSKKEYDSGDSFDPTGLTVTATYSDDSTETIANDKCTWKPSKLWEGDTSVTCEYMSHTATYKGITVKPVPTPAIKGDYGINFKIAKVESTTVLNKTEILTNNVFNNTLVDSIDSVTSVYQGEDGLKVGPRGSISFLLKDIAKKDNIETIYFIGKPYNEEVETVDVLLNEEEVSFDADGEIHSINVSGFFEEGIANIGLSASGAFHLVEFGITVKQVTPTPSSSSSSMPSTTSSVEPVSQSSEPIAPSSSQSQENNKKSGCNGSIIATISISGLSALVGLTFLLSKKKEK